MKKKKKKKIAVDRKGEINIHEINIWKKIFEVSIKILSPSTFPRELKKFRELGSKSVALVEFHFQLCKFQPTKNSNPSSRANGSRDEFNSSIVFSNLASRSKPRSEIIDQNSPSRDYDRIELIRVIIIARWSFATKSFLSDRKFVLRPAFPDRA